VEPNGQKTMVSITGEVDAAEAGSSFTFHALESAFPSLQTQPMRDRLLKWNLQPTMVAKAFRYDQAFQPEQLDAFMLDFFNDPSVHEHAPVALNGGSWGRLGKVTAVRKERLASTLLRLDLFDRLEEHEVVRKGHISGCLDTPCAGLIASDRLRLALLDESSEDWSIFSTTERRELLFHIMLRLAVGGGLNQYEDVMEPYLGACKALYKDLVGVQKDATTGKMQVRSLCYEVADVTAESGALFPRAAGQPGAQHNFCYVCIDPAQRVVKYWYAAWFPMM